MKFLQALPTHICNVSFCMLVLIYKCAIAFDFKDEIWIFASMSVIDIIAT